MRSFLVALAIIALAHGAAGVPRLFATSNGHSGSPPPNLPAGLYELDPTTAAIHFIGALPFQSTTRQYLDVTGRPEDLSNLYSVSRVGGSAFQNWVSRIDVQTAALTDLYDFTPSDFGLAPGRTLELTGIAISPYLPSVATISAATINPATVDIETFLFDLDLGTGAVSNVQTVLNTSYADQLTHAADGTLFARSNDLAMIDRSTGVATEVGQCNCTLFAIEFDPVSGVLFGVDNAGQLFHMSTATGEILDVVGSTGLGTLGGITGLAFIVPEPGTATLLLIGLVGLARRRTRVAA